jgi:hypothetical protein
LRRLERLARAALESGTADAGGGDRPHDQDPALSPSTSKCNRIEHRLFCRITQNWRGRPLTDHATIIELIAATSTKTGLKVESALDTRAYEKGIKITKAEMKTSRHPRRRVPPRMELLGCSPEVKIVAFIVAQVLTGPANRY